MSKTKILTRQIGKHNVKAIRSLILKKLRLLSRPYDLEVEYYGRTRKYKLIPRKAV